jgi:UDP-N-acetylglucosamine 2-epimerase (non-hydrolysing)
LFCPTKTAVENLNKEGVNNGVHLTGDVMVDALKENIEIAEKKSKILDLLSLKQKGYYLATIHRAESTDEFIRLKSIVDAFCVIEKIVFPCHPRTEKNLKQFGLWDKLTKKVKVIKPVGYLDMLMLEKNAKKVLTDSGGVQKEAYIFKVPCIILRDNTEWVETVEDGWNVLVGANKEKIVRMANDFEPEGEQRDVFWSGDASERVMEIRGGLR